MNQLAHIAPASDYDTIRAAIRYLSENGPDATDLSKFSRALGLTEPVEPTVRPFFDRPYLVLGAGRYVEACLARVRDPWLRSLPLVGAIDQFADSSEVVDPGVARRFRAVFGPS